MTGRRVAVLLALCGLAGAYGKIHAQQPVPQVVVAEAQQKPFSDKIEALGTLKANEAVDLTASVTETVVDIGFSDGQRVKKGTVLVKMTGAEEDALLTEARATAKEAGLQYDRAKQLAGRGASSVSSLDEARRVWQTAQARLSAIESRIADLVISAPFDGVVGLRNISVGALVRPGDLITTIDDDSVMKLDFSIPSSFLASVSPGTKVTARSRAFEERAFEGEIQSLSSRVDPVTRTIMVRALLPNPDKLLKPGLLMTVELSSNPRQAILIPEGAILPVGDKAFVMVVDEGHTARRREVQTGGRREGKVEIVSGIKSGQTVITDGAFKVIDGSPVTVARREGVETPAADAQ